MTSAHPAGHERQRDESETEAPPEHVARLRVRGVSHVQVEGRSRLPGLAAQTDGARGRTRGGAGEMAVML